MNACTLHACLVCKEARREDIGPLQTGVTDGVTHVSFRQKPRYSAGATSALNCFPVLPKLHN